MPLDARGLDMAQVKRKFDVRMPMRDGIELSADVWMPAGHRRCAAILVRTPYLKTMELLRFPELGEYFARRGYVVVVQDVRGRGDSDGTFGFHLADEADGYDTVEWLANQPWSNGRVGMMGVSYLAGVQWLAARGRPPHLVCIAPTAPGGLDVAFNYLGGAFLMGWAVPWTNTVSGRIYQGGNTAGVEWDEVYRHRPLLTMDEAFGRPMPLYRQFVEHPDQDLYWDRLHFGPEVFEKIDLPALHVAGWFDGDQPSAMHFWRGMAAHSPAGATQHLTLGPWTHEQAFLGGGVKLGDMEFSGDAVVDMRALHLAFFDHYLKEATPSFDFPRARIYVTGDNRWRDFDRYPPAVVELYAASDSLDTDFTAKILDVFPGGRAVKLGTLPVGAIRARYRNGFGSPELLTPGKAEQYRIQLFDLAHTFLPGHRVRIEISSSAFPFVAPNQNTGNPIPTDTEWRVANQTVYHDREHPSHVALPIMVNP
jgi:predicted acyl esterase